MRKKHMDLSIFGVNYTVYITDELDPNYCGMCIFDSQTILIRKDLPQDIFNITLIHEMLHAFMNRLSYENAITRQTEELLIDQIAKLMTENFKITKRK